MKKIFMGLAMSDTMFQENAVLTRRPISREEIVNLLTSGHIIGTFNPSHKASIDALGKRFNIDVSGLIPETPPRVVLNPGDRLIVLSIRGLPRLTDRHEYTEDEVASATFAFGEWSVS